MTDPLNRLIGTTACPVCASIQPKGSVRCPECGTFHSGAHLEDRSAPAPGENRYIPPDPASYSLNPTGSNPEEEFESADDAVSKWTGGSANFLVEEE